MGGRNLQKNAEKRLEIEESTRARLKHKPLKTDFSEGLCIRCNNPVVPGYKQCEFHHAISIKAGKASAERRRELANG